MRRGRKTPRHGRRWTEEEDLLLRKLWGSNAKTLRKSIERSAQAVRARARVLGLERQSHGLVPRNEACRILGLSPCGLVLFLQDCGIAESAFSPLRDPRRVSASTWKAHDVDVLRQLLLLRENETILAGLWGVLNVGYHRAGRALLEKHGLHAKDAGRRHYIPKGVFQELSAGTTGVWCQLWRTTLSWQRPRLVAPWLLVLLAYTLLQGRAGTWIEDYERPKVESEARELLRACGLGTSHERSARGTSPSTEP